MGLARIDVAVGSDGLTAVVPGFAEPINIPGKIDQGTDDPVPGLSQLFGRLEESVRDALRVSPTAACPRFAIRVALLPPLCDVRIIDLPALRPEETELVLRRDAARHFLGGNRPMVVGATRLGAGTNGATTPVFAGAVPRNFVEALRVAVEARGWELEKIVPAQAAWLSSLLKLKSGRSPKSSGAPDRTVQLIVGVDGDMAHLVRVSGDTPDLLRRLPASDTEAILSAGGSRVGRALLLSVGENGDLAAGLRSAGWVLVQPASSRSPSVVAAREAGDASLELVPDFIERTRRDKSRGVTMRLLAGAMLMLAAAAVVHLWGTARRLDRIRAERAELSSAVAPALAMRDSIDLINARLEELQVLGGQSRRWTTSLIELTRLLPPETHLVSLRAAGDTVLIEASGGRAGEAMAAMGASQLLQDVRLEGSIERDLEEGSMSGERFTLNAILASPPPGDPAAAPGGAPMNADR